MIKKVTALLATGVLLFGLVGCQAGGALGQAETLVKGLECVANKETDEAKAQIKASITAINAALAAAKLSPQASAALEQAMKNLPADWSKLAGECK